MKGKRGLTGGGVAGWVVCMAWLLSGPIQATAAFQDNGNGTVSDTVTGLMWQKGDTQNDAGGRTWEEALNYCESLTLPSGGYSDWRLPNIRELETLVDWDRYDPAINTTYFPACRSSFYWSSSTGAYDPDSAWGVNFYYGYVLDGYKTGAPYVWCVRGGPSGSFGNLDHFVISNTSGGDIPAQAVNAPFSVLIKAVDAAGTTVTSFNGDVSLSISCGVYPDKVVLASGQATPSLKLYSGGYVQLNCSYQGIYGNSNSFNVTGGSAPNGKIGGRVIDGREDPIYEALVELYQGESEIAETLTNLAGNFTFSNRPPGTYDLKISRMGKIRWRRGVVCPAENVGDIMIPINGGTAGTPVILLPGMMGSSRGK